MTTLRLSERGAGSPKRIVERAELSDDSGAIRYLKTNPSNDEVLEEREASEHESERFTDHLATADRGNRLRTALANWDTLTAAQRNEVVKRVFQWLLRRWDAGAL